MQLYGEYKKNMRVHGHGHNCLICKPSIYKKTGRRKAREANKRIIKESDY